MPDQYSLESRGSQTTISGNNLGTIKQLPNLFYINNAANITTPYKQGVGGLAMDRQVIYGYDDSDQLIIIMPTTKVETKGMPIIGGPFGKDFKNGSYALCFGDGTNIHFYNGTQINDQPLEPITAPDPTTATSKYAFTASIVDGTKLQIISLAGNVGDAVTIGQNATNSYVFSTVKALKNGDFIVFGVNTDTGEVVTTIFGTSLKNNLPERKLEETKLSSNPYIHSDVAAEVKEIDNSDGYFLDLIARSTKASPLEYNITAWRNRLGLLNQQTPTGPTGGPGLLGGSSNNIALYAGAGGGAVAGILLFGVLFGKKTADCFRKLCGRRPANSTGEGEGRAVQMVTTSSSTESVGRA